MSYTVKKVAKMSGVSTRTLHFYDEIGLLKPAYYAVNGYRYYEEEQLLILQQILFFRELGLELKKIQDVLKRDDFDKIDALQSHRKVMIKEVDRRQELIQTIDKTIARLKEKKPMKDQELYYGFSHEKQEEYEKYISNRITKKGADLVSESKRRVKGWKKEDWEAVNRESDELHKQLAEAIKKGFEPTSTEVQSLIRKHFQWIHRFYTPTKDVYIGLGQLYVEHADFRKLYDSYHPQLAEFMAKAMKEFSR